MVFTNYWAFLPRRGKSQTFENKNGTVVRYYKITNSKTFGQILFSLEDGQLWDDANIMKIYPGRKMNMTRIPNHPLSCPWTLHSHSQLPLQGSQPLFGSSLAPQHRLSLLPNPHCLSQWVWVGQRSVPGQTEGQAGVHRVTRAWICPYTD